MTATAPSQTADTTTGIAAEDTSARQSRGYVTCPTAREEFMAWLTASCERQGLPVTVTDAATLAAIAALLH
jgi:hypothetical protein